MLYRFINMYSIWNSSKNNALNFNQIKLKPKLETKATSSEEILFSFPRSGNSAVGLCVWINACEMAEDRSASSSHIVTFCCVPFDSWCVLSWHVCHASMRMRESNFGWWCILFVNFSETTTKIKFEKNPTEWNWMQHIVLNIMPFSKCVNVLLWFGVCEWVVVSNQKAKSQLLIETQKMISC